MTAGLRQAYPSIVIQDVQCIFIMYDLAGKDRKNFQQLSKLIELIFISTS